MEACPSRSAAPAHAARTSVFNRQGKSFADAVKSASAPPLSGANSIPMGPPKQRSILGRRSVFHRLQPPLGGRVHGVPAAQSSEDFVGDRAPTPFCLRCLSQGHYRAACRRPIRCHACHNWGHTAVNCRSGKIFKPGQVTGNSKSLAANSSPFGWLNAAAAGPSSSSPPVFKSFAEKENWLGSMERL